MNAQQPIYDDPAARDVVVGQLQNLPPLVFAGECDDLKTLLAKVADGQGFVLQGGDCAETFDGLTANAIKARLRVLLSMSVVLAYAGQTPVITLGRMAGQYAKPRSSDTETRDGVTLPAYRGDAVNGFEFTEAARRHDPQRMLRAYNAASATLNLVRAFMAGGFGDVRQAHTWNAQFVRDSHVQQRYEQVAGEIERAIGFLAACGLTGHDVRAGEFFASHEALLLDYERAMIRTDYRTGLPYDTSGHLLWIGERTRAVDGPHVAMLAQVRNPLAVKLGPNTAPAEAVALAQRLDPDHEPGRLTFITRLGAKNVRRLLPSLIAAVGEAGYKVCWICDPMHGNTVTTESGFKTRRIDDIVEEIDGFFDVHSDLGTWPGGIHVELTGEEVTECLGGAFDTSEAELSDHYETLCDPRLNRNQALELAFRVAERLGAIAEQRRPDLDPADW